MEIGERIKAARLERGMKQTELAKRLRLRPSAVAQWESQTTTPSIANRANIARILAIPFADLLPKLGDGAKEITVSDPSMIKIVQLLSRMSPQEREAFLMAVAASFAALDGFSGKDAPALEEDR